MAECDFFNCGKPARYQDPKKGDCFCPEHAHEYFDYEDEMIDLEEQNQK